MREPHNISQDRIYRDALGRFPGIHPDYTRIVNVDMITPAHLEPMTLEEVVEELRTAGVSSPKWIDVNGYQMTHSLELNTVYVRRAPDHASI